jgi:hypothetical protein
VWLDVGTGVEVGRGDGVGVRDGFDVAVKTGSGVSVMTSTVAIADAKKSPLTASLVWNNPTLAVRTRVGTASSPVPVQFLLAMTSNAPARLVIMITARTSSMRFFMTPSLRQKPLINQGPRAYLTEAASSSGQRA